MAKRADKTKKPLAEFLQENYFDSEHEAQAAVKLGIVYVNGKLAKRAGIIVDEVTDKIKVIGDGKIFVSRGGYKLQKALKVFDVEVVGKTCLDIGASTGGFSDCLLQEGVEAIYAIDTGYGQLDWKIRTNEKVTTVERMNVRYLLPERLYGNPETEKATLAVVDVSFISVIKILPSLQNLLAGPNKSEFVILIKPQFEAGKNQVGRGGLIKNPTIHLEILSNFVTSCYRAGLDIRKVTHSPLLGASGNLEFLAYATWPKAGPSINPQLSDWLGKIINIAYEEFNLNS